MHAIDLPPADAVCAVAVEFTVKEGYADQFAARVTMQAAESLREPGCWQFDVCVDRADPHLVFLYEVYTDADAFQAHLASDHFQQFDAATRAWVSSKRVTIWRRAGGGS